MPAETTHPDDEPTPFCEPPSLGSLLDYQCWRATTPLKGGDWSAPVFSNLNRLSSNDTTRAEAITTNGFDATIPLLTAEC
jgi:hypothetical protein